MTADAVTWQPTCSVAMLRRRAELFQAVRTFFSERGYLEVDTPVLSRDIVIDAHLHPIDAVVNGSRLFLQTSPEAAMKRLLAAGSGSIFQITRAFRNEEIGPLHEPEFAMLEWYGVNSTWEDQMTLTEQLVRHTGQVLGTSVPGPFLRTGWREAFTRCLGVCPLTASVSELQKQVRRHAHLAEMPDDRDDLLNALLASVVEPQLGRERPEFLYDYPVSQAALAVASADDSRLCRRFELYLGGVEICNGYQELTDPDEFQRREHLQSERRRRSGSRELPGAPRLHAALASGLPDCSGVALGLDRLLLLLTGRSCLAEVIPFAGGSA